MTVQEFRDGIFALRTRRFGSVAEILIKKLFGYSFSDVLNYDLIDVNQNLRIEVKFSTVLKNNSAGINEDNILDQCEKANLANRVIQSSDIQLPPDLQPKFDCNIQQVKCQEFDVLYYGLFFSDKIEIFKVSSESVKNCPANSEKQHRNNVGEGQFHINNDTYQYHKDNNYIRELSYQEFLNLLRS